MEKAKNFKERFREIASDPLNLLIERHPAAGSLDAEGNITVHNGNKMLATGYYGTFGDILMINRGVHEPLEEFCFQQMLKKVRKDPVMLELGAYWAHYSLWLKRLYPSATVIMVEPDPAHLSIGQKNFELNGHIGEFIRAFVSRGNFEVDEFIETRNLAKLDILHADIQSYEEVMLECAKKSFAERKIDYLFLSTHSDKLHNTVIDSLKASGYRVEVESNVSTHTTSYDGFVLATSPNIDPLFRDFKPLGRLDILSKHPRELVGYLDSLLPAL